LRKEPREEEEGNNNISNSSITRSIQMQGDSQVSLKPMTSTIPVMIYRLKNFRFDLPIPEGCI